MKELMNTCAWCGIQIPEDVEVFGLGARARAGTDLRDVEGTFIPMPLTLISKTVHACVVTSDSEAKKEGYDFAFLACSERCAESLKAALQRELDTFSRVELLH